ncbi:IS21-like element helper ATPase IstB [Pedobacter westerhofensis]|uniref:IS21-like element helper ATPase IstB n=1 Tax=Pedobacter westerhofensis TaxID=425512 RepID=UPI001FE3F9AB|nr:IS21-like element helper ATPase IstB [Pedobacter westerhofensis]
MVYIYARGKQAAVHIRSYQVAGYTTVKEHLNSHHRHYLDRSPTYYIEKAKEKSPELHLLVQLLFEQPRHPEQLYRTCDGLLRLQKKAPAASFAKACELAIEYRNFSYRFVGRILQNNMEDHQDLPAKEQFLPVHGNIRGKEYYTNHYPILKMNIETQLKQLRLHGMGRSWQALMETRKHHELSFTEGMEMLLQAEEDDRSDKRFERLQRGAHFRYQASIEELQLETSRGLDKSLVANLATGDYIAKGEAVLVCGSTGTGKSFLASALGHHACSQGYKVVYYNLHKLLLKTKMSRIDGTIYKFFEKLSRTDLLILDDFGLTHLEQQQRMDFMEIIEDRHASKTTIIASQLPVASWYDVIGENTIADALLDRMVHTSYRIELKGESLRKKK